MRCYDLGKKNNNKKIYNNRELSWLEFNSRILEEAGDVNNPVMECAKFLGISSSNLDEFFMVRVSGLLNKIEKRPNKKDAFGLKPKKVFKKLEKKLHKFSKKQYKCFNGFLIPKLRKVGIRFLNIKDLDDSQKIFLKEHFKNVILPVLTPLAIDTGRPFPFLVGRTLNIAVEMVDDKDNILFGIVSVPSVLKRYIKLPGDNNDFVFLEDLIEDEIQNVFELYEVKSTKVFRVTRDSDLDVNDEANNLLQEVKKTIKKRRRGDVVRLEISDYGDKKIKKFLAKNLKLKQYDIYKHSGPLDLSFLSKFYKESWDNSLKFAQKPPRHIFAGIPDGRLFDLIRKDDILV